MILVAIGLGLVLIGIGATLIFRAMRSSRAAVSRAAAVARENEAVIVELRKQAPVTVQQIAARLDTNRDAFLDDVQRAVHDYIAGQGTRCLAIVERGAEGEALRTWTLNLTNPEYVKRLFAFCLEKPYNGHRLDSALTDPVIDVIIDQFRGLFENSGTVIAREILSNGTLARCVARNVRDARVLEYVAEKLRSRAAEVVLEQLQHAIEQKTGVTITATEAAALAASVATYLYAHLGGTVTVLVAKSLATPVVTKALILVLKKFVVAAIIGATAKALALKLGIGVHALATFVLIPLIGVLIAWDVTHFPRELGDKVSKQVRNQLAGTFAEVNTSIAESLMDNIIDSFIDAGVGSVVEGWIAAPDVSDGLRQLVGALPAA